MCPKTDKQTSAAFRTELSPFTFEETFMSTWSGDLFVFKDGQGQEYISGTLPTGVAMPASALKRYRASGPYMPMSWPAPTAVGDAAGWMIERQKKGFVFETVNAQDGSPSL
jgi:hypothetical protein